jgi:hypothetical protein
MIAGALKAKCHANHRESRPYHPCAVRDHRRALGRNPQRLTVPIREAPPGNDDCLAFPQKEILQ